MDFILRIELPEGARLVQKGKIATLPVYGKVRIDEISCVEYCGSVLVIYGRCSKI